MGVRHPQSNLGDRTLLFALASPPQRGHAAGGNSAEFAVPRHLFSSLRITPAAFAAANNVTVPRRFFFSMVRSFFTASICAGEPFQLNTTGM